MRRCRRRRPVTRDEADAVIAALELMLKLRKLTPYGSRGFKLLNAACCQLSERFWRDAGWPREARP